MSSTLRASLRAQITPPSPIRKLAPLASAAKKEGTYIFHLNIGQPDIESPGRFLAAVQDYREPVVAYEQSEGNARLRTAWANFMNQGLGLSLSAEHFLITMGASEALIFAFMVCADPGEEVLVMDPSYANYLGFAAISGIKLVPIATYLDSGFTPPTAESIAALITPKTRAILLCNPNNPTGTVYSDEQLRGLLAICQQQGLYLIVDETYRDFVYDGLKPSSVLQLAPNDPHLVVVDSISKRFSLCGARIGALISYNKSFLSYCLALAQARLAAPTVEQLATASLLEGLTLEEVRVTCAEYQHRRDAVLEELQKLPDSKAHCPEGGFYTIVRLPVADSEDFARFMLNKFRANSSRGKATTFVAPAAGFYIDAVRASSKIRVAFVLGVAELREAVALLNSGLQAYLQQSRR
jgi:aspartate aminotransferase